MAQHLQTSPAIAATVWKDFFQMDWRWMFGWLITVADIRVSFTVIRTNWIQTMIHKNRTWLWYALIVEYFTDHGQTPGLLIWHCSKTPQTATYTCHMTWTFPPDSPQFKFVLLLISCCVWLTWHHPVNLNSISETARRAEQGFSSNSGREWSHFHHLTHRHDPTRKLPERSTQQYFIGLIPQTVQPQDPAHPSV